MSEKQEEHEPVKKKAPAKKATSKKAPAESHDDTSCNSPSCTHEHHSHAGKKESKDASHKEEHAGKEEPTAPAKVEESVDTKEFHTDRIDAILETRSYCRVKLIVKGKASFMKDSRKLALKKVAKEVSMPGFRKGKVPDAILEKQFSSAIAQSWDRAFADMAFQEGQKLAKVVSLGGDARISYQVTKLTSEEGEISFSFETEPVIPEIDLKKISLNVKEGPEEVTETHMQNTVRYIQMFYARWQQVSDRPIKEGDFVVLDIDDLDQDPPVQAFSNARFEVAQGKMADWMRSLVIGKKVDDQIEGISTPDAHESDAVKAEFKPKKVKIHIRGVEEALLPEVNDEFAKKLGAPDTETLKKRLKALLLKQANERFELKLRDELSEKLIDTFTFDIPASILEKEANYRMHQLLRQPEFVRKWKEEMTEGEKEAKKHEVKDEAVRILKIFYLCRKIVTENGIELREDELERDYSTVLDMMFADPDTVNYKNQSKEQKALAFSKFMMTKALDFLVHKIRNS